MELRIGHGNDAHRLKTGRKLILGGIEIPWEKGLDGHSDADVLIHAVMDAFLGALAMGDIGGMFPDHEEAYRDADSTQLLERVWERVTAAGWHLENLDATIIAQAPKLSPHLPGMREVLAGICGANTSRISIKATTEERMGFTGSEEGICAHAVCLLRKSEEELSF